MAASRRSFAIVAVALMAACTTPERTATPPAAASSTSSGGSTQSPSLADALPSPPASASELPGALLVRTIEGGLAVVTPDGVAQTGIAVGVPGELRVVTAAWAPDGRRIAWSQLDVAAGVPSAAVLWSDADGGRRSEARLPFAPFYLSWDPTSSRVAFLGGSGPLTLGIAERSGGSLQARPLARGQPFYFSWSPTGGRLVTHVAGSRLDTLTVEGVAQRLEPRTGEFQAPVWTPDGITVIYATSAHHVVARDVATGSERVIADVDGSAFVVLSPDGNRIAFHARGPQELYFYDLALPDRATDLGVRVVGLGAGPEVRATEDPAIAWSWSPDGRRLAILEPVYLDTAIRFRWVIWSDDGSFATEPFVAGAAFQQDVSFFSQYAQSSKIWAPDSSAIAYPADMADGSVAIWIQPARAGAAPYPITRGTSVAWSPAAS